jgi:hypothetical protein
MKSLTALVLWDVLLLLLFIIVVVTRDMSIRFETAVRLHCCCMDEIVVSRCPCDSLV